MPEIAVPQGTIAYREAGAGEPIVFLHGYLMDSRLWEPVMARLSSQMRCIALDLPLGAHRRAMKPDADLSARGLADLVAAAIAELGTGPVTLVGNDSGGAIAQQVAVRHPEVLSRLVLTPCDCFENFPPALFRPLVALAHVPGGLTAAFSLLRLRAPRRLPIAYGWVTKRRPLPHDLIADWVGAFYADRGVRRDTAKVTRGLRPEVTLESAERLRDFRRPTLIAFAPEDKLFPFAHAERLAAAMPDARAAAVEDSRTWVMVDQPERTAELIREFVRAHPRKAQATAG